MQQIQVEMISTQTRKARRASTGDAISSDFIGLHFGDQEDTLALTGNHVPEKLLGAAIPVVSRGIDQRHAELNAGAYRLCFERWRVSSLPQMPGALAERGDGGAVWKPHGTPRGLRYRGH